MGCMSIESDLRKFIEAKRLEIAQNLKHISPGYRETETAQADAKAAIRHGQNEALKTRYEFTLGNDDPLSIGLNSSDILWSLLEWQWAAKHPAYPRPQVKKIVDDSLQDKVNRRLAAWKLTMDDPTAKILISCLDDMAELLLDGSMRLKDYTNKSYLSESISQARYQIIINTTMDDVVEKAQEFRNLEARWLPPTHKYV